MNRNLRNPDWSDDGNVFDIKKTSYCGIYGVKRFPYHGKRKFTPLLSKSFDEGMVISNDVFGLTISQFERMYKACLERRKTKEQYILNLRYPDKSSKKYLEYLQNCTDNYKDHLLWIDSRETNLYEQLEQIVGTEVDIRTRQRLFIIQDKVVNSFLPRFEHISSGSLAEGLDLPGSDIDTMFVVNMFVVVHNLRNVKYPVDRVIFKMEPDLNHPGFTRLRLVANTCTDRNSSIRFICNCPTGTCTGKPLYLRVIEFLDYFKDEYVTFTCFHGPCISNEALTVDHAYCIRSIYLPHMAIQWAARHRRQWPPNFVIDRIIHCGCLLVPIGPKTVSDGCLWRVSFSVAEKNTCTFV